MQECQGSAKKLSSEQYAISLYFLSPDHKANVGLANKKSEIFIHCLVPIEYIWTRRNGSEPKSKGCLSVITRPSDQKSAT